MSAGNEARCRAKANDILATMAVNEIASGRTYDKQAKQTLPMEKTAHLIRSLKTPEEVRRLRDVYRPGFFLIGIASDDVQQHTYLTKEKGLTDEEANQVIERDQNGSGVHLGSLCSSAVTQNRPCKVSSKPAI